MAPEFSMGELIKFNRLKISFSKGTGAACAISWLLSMTRMSSLVCA